MDQNQKDCLEAQQEARQNYYDHLEFMARMYSHNMKAPMAGLKMLIEIAETNPDSVDSELLDNIIEGSRELFKTIDDLSVNLQDYRLFQSPKTPVLLQELTREMLDPIRDELELSTDYGQCEELEFYPDMLRLVYRELINNALHFKKAGQKAKLKITARCDQQWLRLSFKDEGLGIDLEKNHHHLFKMYKPLQGNAVKQGRGTGLFRVKNLVEISGGKVQLKSKPGQGTEVLIRIPYC